MVSGAAIVALEADRAGSPLRRRMPEVHDRRPANATAEVRGNATAGRRGVKCRHVSTIAVEGLRYFHLPASISVMPLPLALFTIA